MSIDVVPLTFVQDAQFRPPVCPIACVFETKTQHLLGFAALNDRDLRDHSE